MYEISAAYPELQTYYGTLCGLANTIPYSIFGLVAASAAQTCNRKYLLVGVITAMSLS